MPKKRRWKGLKARLKNFIARKLSLEPVREVRSREKPVKVVFQCIEGMAWSGTMKKSFEAFLQERGLEELFEVEKAGMSRSVSPEKYLSWQEKVKEADLVVGWKRQIYKQHRFKLPRKGKVFYSNEVLPGLPMPALFGFLLDEAYSRFILEDKPKKPKQSNA